MGDLNNSCRLCLNIVEESDLYSLFDVENPNDYCGIEWRRLFSFIYRVDGLSSYICRTCKDQVVWFLNFQQRCYENDFYLRTTLEIKPGPAVVQGPAVQPEYLNTETIEEDNTMAMDPKPDHTFSEEPVIDNDYNQEQLIITKNEEPVMFNDYSNDSDSVTADKIYDDKNFINHPHKSRVSIRRIDKDEQISEQSYDTTSMNTDMENYNSSSTEYSKPKKRCRKGNDNLNYGEFICSICNKQFSTRSILNRHTNIHTAEKTFECTAEGCGKMFLRKNSRDDHYYIHHMGFVYKCSACGNTQKSLRALRAHASKKHPGETAKSEFVKKK